MIKIDEENRGTLSRCAPGEPIFVLRAKDRLAPTAIRIWVQLAKLTGVSLAKRAEALELANQMENWAAKHEDKLPD